MSSTALPGVGETNNPPIACNGTISQLDSYRNTLHKDPCEVADSLLANQECATNGSVMETNRVLRKIIDIQDARDATPDQFNRCLCSSPVYALLSFCRSCQRSSNLPVFADWAAWTSKCFRGATPQSFVVFPVTNLLEQEHVMKWVNDTRNFEEGSGDFSLQETKKHVEGPEGDRSEFGPPASTTTSPTNEDSPSGGGINTGDTNNQQALSSSKKAPVGPIVGGVVGGVALLALLGLLFWYLRRRRKGNKEAPSAAYIRACGGHLNLTPYVAGNRESVQYPNEKAILAERERNSLKNMEQPVRNNSNTETSDSGSFYPYTPISEIDRLQIAG